MKILTLSGSARLPDSYRGSNRRLLNVLADLWPDDEISFFNIHELPLFTDEPKRSLHEQVDDFKVAVLHSNAIIIATPEYAHNLPAALKNALEWLVAGGEASEKKVLPITLTPHPPRGEKCMQSLCWTLVALNCRVVSQLSLYRDDLLYRDDGSLADCLGRQSLLAARDLL